MQYYMIEWENEEMDDPWRLYLELDRYGCICRKVEAYRVGIYETFEDPENTPVDPQQLAGSEGHVSKITRPQFDDIWAQSRETGTGSFMNMYF